MDELEISGKRYISSRRAGKEHKYHPDYIGQLVRAGKVEGQKVGRAWYVDADSLSRYLSQDLGPRGPVEKIVETPVPVEIKIPEQETEEEIIAEEPVEVIKEIPVVAAQAEEPQEIVEEKEELALEIQINKIEEKKAPVVIQQKRTGGLIYLADDAPLFPAIKKNAIPMTTVPMRALSLQEEMPHEEARILPRTFAASTTKPKKKLSLARAGLTLVVLAGVTFGVAFLLFSNVVTTMSVTGGQAANVSYSLK